MKKESCEHPIFEKESPLLVEVVSNSRITGENSENNIRHIEFKPLDDAFTYTAGQYIAFLIGEATKPERSSRQAFYSIASAFSAQNKGRFSVCSKRISPPAFNDDLRSVSTSQFICDLKPGDRVPIIGPFGNDLALPDEAGTHLILIAAGTGIAPFRGFMQSLFLPNATEYGQTFLFFGAGTAEEAIYMNDMNDDLGKLDGQKSLQIIKVLSRENISQNDQKTYIQHRLREMEDSILPLIREGKFSLYLCGMKNLEHEVDQVFKAWAEKDGKDWVEMKENFTLQGRWNIQVY